MAFLRGMATNQTKRRGRIHCQVMYSKPLLDQLVESRNLNQARLLDSEDFLLPLVLATFNFCDRQIHFGNVEFYRTATNSKAPFTQLPFEDYRVKCVH